MGRALRGNGQGGDSSTSARRESREATQGPLPRRGTGGTMRRIRWFAIVAAVMAIALVGVACGGDDPDTGGGNGTTLSGDIRIDGSSTVGPLTEAAAEFFQEENPDVRVTVGISGTGGGFEKFCAGETDANDASREIEPDEEELCTDSGSRVGRDAGRERRYRRRHQPGERLGGQPHGRAVEDDLERGQHDRQLEPGRSELPGRPPRALRPRHGLGDVRLLHRRHQR